MKRSVSGRDGHETLLPLSKVRLVPQSLRGMKDKSSCPCDIAHYLPRGPGASDEYLAQTVDTVDRAALAKYQLASSNRFHSSRTAGLW
jgi:hypothetical protein